MSDHAPTANAHSHGEAHTHPPYLKIFGILALLTLVELVIPLLFHDAKGIGLTILIAIAIWKIWLIIRFFMHLKFDARILGMVASAPALFGSILAIGLLLDFA